MLLDFLSSIKTHFAQASDPRIRVNNLNYIPFAKSLVSHSMLKLSGNTRVTIFSCYCITVTGAIHLSWIHTCYVQQAVLSPPV